MSIGIFDLNKRKARALGLAVLCCAGLSACSDAVGEGFAFSPLGGIEKPQTAAKSVPHSKQTQFARGAIKLKAPAGFCIDESSVKNGLQSSSALLASCSSLQGKSAGSNAAVITVQISGRRGEEALAPSADDLAKAAAPNEVISQKQNGSLALVQLASGGDKVLGPADPKHWRGATLLDTRLVLFGLFAREGSDLASQKGADLLTSLARGLSTNPAPVFGLRAQAPATISPDRPTTEANTSQEIQGERKKAGFGFIGRLLNRS